GYPGSYAARLSRVALAWDGEWASFPYVVKEGVCRDERMHAAVATFPSSPQYAPGSPVFQGLAGVPAI
ncbi:MAG: hypothetical protein KJ827_02400, partial [Alphaproteobacteria bacterium]|nr:hypothetical protein [Alphaproteobacteria bacterium]